MTEQKSKALLNFKKAHSLIATMMEMARKDAYCIDIMQQNLAAIGLLRSAHLMLIEDHLNTCFKKAIGTRNEKKQDEMILELLKVTKMSFK